ncbi:uncharacterized protein LOC109934117 [Rhincodon typus]|uniref:uncharacterized protein LOC109934117 n=1 Tax=Rhincodon typus TaxID=259920 RepID=UPI0009A3874D|nr:uncharacterized protein LOC109934117 [Rhincodon typus]
MAPACIWGLYTSWLLSTSFSSHDISAAPMESPPCLIQSELRRFSEAPKRLPPSNECMLNCTVLTYMKILRQRKRMTVRLHNSVTASENEYCWPSHLRCRNGERLDKAFVFLDTNKEKQNVSVGYILNSVMAMSAQGVHVTPQVTSSIMSEQCGITFDMTKLFKATVSTLCVQVTCQDNTSISCDSLNNTLKCPPFLATVWSRT